MKLYIKQKVFSIGAKFWLRTRRAMTDILLRGKF